VVVMAMVLSSVWDGADRSVTGNLRARGRQLK
jgi:hypothetical protein